MENAPKTSMAPARRSSLAGSKPVRATGDDRVSVAPATAALGDVERSRGAPDTDARDAGAVTSEAALPEAAEEPPFSLPPLVNPLSADDPPAPCVARTPTREEAGPAVVELVAPPGTADVVVARVVVVVAPVFGLAVVLVDLIVVLVVPASTVVVVTGAAISMV
jgi:hypothetical protein